MRVSLEVFWVIERLVDRRKCRLTWDLIRVLYVTDPPRRFWRTTAASFRWKLELLSSLKADAPVYPVLRPSVQSAEHWIWHYFYFLLTRRESC